MKAYEMIDELSRLFGPGYTPSPGAVYPAIQALVDERLFRTESAGRAKRYVCSAAGHRLLEERRPTLAQIEQRCGARFRDEQKLRPMLDRFVEQVMAMAGHVEPSDVQRLLDDAAERLEAARRSS